MNVEYSSLSVHATKPVGRIGRALSELGMRVFPVEEDEGNVDRYIISRRLVIERRTPSSFLMGIMDKTLFTSAIYMREHFRIPVLIIEGTLDANTRGFSPEAVRGALSSMMLLYAVNVVFTSSTEETTGLIVMMTRQEQIGIPDISLIPKRKAATLDDMQRRVVEMLPGCGMVAARDLLQHFGSIDAIVSATEDELKGIRGIGAKKAAQIRRVLNAEYESVDSERALEDAIEHEPSLLFRQPVTLLARQHHIFTEDKRKHIVDMVFLDEDMRAVILVELKLGRIEAAHHTQITRYLDRAHQSKLIGPFLNDGFVLQGILATVEQGECRQGRGDVTIRIVDRPAAIRTLTRMRRDRVR